MGLADNGDRHEIFACYTRLTENLRTHTTNQQITRHMRCGAVSQLERAPDFSGDERVVCRQHLQTVQLCRYLRKRWLGVQGRCRYCV